MRRVVRRRRPVRRPTYFQRVQQPRGGRGDRLDRLVERGAIVRGGRPETRDLADVLQRRGVNVLLADLRRHRRAKGLDASAHTASVRQTSDKCRIAFDSADPSR